MFKAVKINRPAKPATWRQRAVPARHARPVQSGQALVELALALPFLLLLALGVIELGRFAYISILVGNAAHAGAVYGSQGTGASSDTTGIQNAAEYDFAGGTSAGSNANGQPISQLTVTSSTSCGCDGGGTITNSACNVTPSCPASQHWVVVVSVTAAHQFSSLFNYPGLPSSITVSRTSTMRVL